MQSIHQVTAAGTSNKQMVHCKCTYGPLYKHGIPCFCHCIQPLLTQLFSGKIRWIGKKKLHRSANLEPKASCSIQSNGGIPRVISGNTLLKFNEFAPEKLPRKDHLPTSLGEKCQAHVDISGQITTNIFPKPECFGDSGGIPLLFTTI